MNDLLFLRTIDKLPYYSYVTIREKFANLSEAKQEKMSKIDLKDPMVGLLLSFLLGILGVDRFYKGDILIGFLKLFTLGGVFIWALIDWFLIVGGIKRDNLEKIDRVLTQADIPAPKELHEV